MFTHTLTLSLERMISERDRSRRLYLTVSVSSCRPFFLFLSQCVRVCVCGFMLFRKWVCMCNISLFSHWMKVFHAACWYYFCLARSNIRRCWMMCQTGTGNKNGGTISGGCTWCVTRGLRPWPGESHPSAIPAQAGRNVILLPQTK